MRSAAIAMGLGVILVSAAGAVAQPPPLSNACQTAVGVCPAPVAPVGAPCVCAGRDPGRMIFTPAMPPQAPQRSTLATACGTPFGVCQTNPAPVGAPCTCFGPRGPDAGRMIWMR